ncbi:DUF2306 domain-containing protein [Pseudoduganella violacea]|uniref:Putative membrane protein n=1 Tax=Pseudoduganella violacea TaxID=1715466 RepID=A0A7W5B6G3_9BURK|nr:DUF2306 domain-containing protein [Pseudoduganella violacea]MBB3117311.1 putative membrane protein [Pseudoduganella violacea]
MPVSSASFYSKPMHAVRGATWPAAALNAAATLWFLLTLAGQLIFVTYIVALYGGAVVRGDLQGWNQVMSHGYVVGDRAGNMAIGAHLLLAAVIMLGGALQLIPRVRTIAPTFHRWNGRVYLAGAVAGSLSGLYILWFRGAVGDTVQHIGTSLNAALILLCSGIALRTALARDFGAHRRWALRLFLCVSGVWFFRIGLMFWLALNGGPAGFDPKTFTGPFLSFLAYAQYLLPLAVLELYLRCREHANAAARCAMAAVLLVLSAATALGVAVATMGMWLPRM